MHFWNMPELDRTLEIGGIHPRKKRKKQMEENRKNWLTIEEAATYLRCGERILREIVANRQIPHVKFAGKALFYPPRLDEWLLGQEVKIEKLASIPAGLSAREISDSKHIPVRSNCDKAKVNALIRELSEYVTANEAPDEFVRGLGKNLRKDLEKSDYNSVKRKTYARLSRWCHPNRYTGREEWVKIRAHEISVELFGHVIDRTSDPSYG